jgi:heme/copper-type cytochrome/quinol oxidase subunit 2
MFSSGQKIFAVLFVIVFAVAMVWTYRKDLKLHKIYYKNVYIVALSILAIILLFVLITFSMH